ncbi:hypothetical protein NEUTE2DRAFT_129848 [Neurospora tetrasperma FGSC 2509]|nr:hypothetical protein NEUTE2DRAFT_129848 [Neurospora tetrasperma FGSC 2509]
MLRDQMIDDGSDKLPVDVFPAVQYDGLRVRSMTEVYDDFGGFQVDVAHHRDLVILFEMSLWLIQTSTRER